MGNGAAQSARSARRPGRTFKAHWSVFVPTIAITVLFGAAWGWLVVAGSGAGTLARVSISVLVFGVPITATLAALRYHGVRVRVGKRTVVLNRGWPHRRLSRLRLADMAAVDVRRDVLGRCVDAGTVVFVMRDGSRHSVSDIAQPDGVEPTIALLKQG
jgi:uncharacterized membrane protein YdbT with pleckstrin-like domain